MLAKYRGKPMNYGTSEHKYFHPYWEAIQAKIESFQALKNHYHELQDTEWTNTSLNDATKEHYKTIEKNYADAIELLKSIKRPFSHFINAIELLRSEAGDEASALKGFQASEALAKQFLKIIQDLNPNEGITESLKLISDGIKNNISLVIKDIETLSQKDGKINFYQRIVALLCGIGFALLACVTSIFKIILRPKNPLIDNILGSIDAEDKGDYGDRGWDPHTNISSFFLNAFDSFKSAWTGQEESPEMKRIERELNKLLKTLKDQDYQFNNVDTTNDPTPVIHEGTPFYDGEKFKDVFRPNFRIGHFGLYFSSTANLRNIFSEKKTALDQSIAPSNKFFQHKNSVDIPATKEEISKYKKAIAHIKDVDKHLHHLVVIVSKAQKEMSTPYPKGLSETMAVINELHSLLQNKNQGPEAYYQGIAVLTKKSAMALEFLGSDIKNRAHVANRAGAALYGVGYALATVFCAILTIPAFLISTEGPGLLNDVIDQVIDFFFKAIDSFKAASTGMKEPPEMKQLQRAFASFHNELQKNINTQPQEEIHIDPSSEKPSPT